MQFGVGILGSGWKLEDQQKRMRADTRHPRANFQLHAECYAAKIAADSILAEPPTAPDLSDEGMVQALGNCALTPRPSEYPMIREAFTLLSPPQPPHPER